MKTILLACAATLVLGGTAWAQQAMTTTALQALDTGGDGAVDEGELMAFMDKAFKALDKNGDGYVTIVESEVVLTPEQFAAANTNGDDGISLQEWQDQAAKDLAAADRDGNGKLD